MTGELNVLWRRARSRSAGAALAACLVPPARAQPAVQKATTAKVTVLSTMLADIQGIGEWGFAALVEVDGSRLLFDTGARPDTVLRNAEELKLDLAGIRDVILSHHHADYTGGLVALREALRAKNADALSRAH